MPDRQTAHLQVVFADDAGFDDAGFPGVYPLASGKLVSAVKFSPEVEYFSAPR